MKIFEIGTGYTSIPARMGAATEIVVAELTTSIQKMGEDVTIVDIKDKERLNSELPIIEAWMPQFFSNTDTTLGIVHKLKRVVYSVSLTYKLHRLIRSCKDEKIVLHFHNQYNLFFFLKLTPKSLRDRVAIAYTVHSYIWFGEWDKIKDTISKRYFQEVYCCQHADKVFVLNDMVADMLVEHYGVGCDRVVKVINGVNVDVYNDEAVAEKRKEELKAQCGLVGRKVVFQVGSVCDRKNQLGTLRQLIPIMKKDKDLTFVYAGGVIDSVYAESILDFAKSEGVSGQVKFMGEVSPGVQLNALYAISDVAFMNSKSEAFALVIAEALSARKPIMVCDAIMRSLSFWGKNEGSGIIRIKEGSFADDLNRLFTDKVYYDEMRKRGRELVVKEYSWDVVAKQYINNF